MKRVRVKGFKVFKDRHGEPRCYHRATGIPIDMKVNPLGSAGFFAECQRISALVEKGQAAKPGTLGLLVQKYRAHAQFTDLAPRNKSDYQKIFDYLQPIAETPLTWFTPPRIVRIRDKAGEGKGRRFGTYVKTVLSVVFGWGVERGFMATNPAYKIKGIRKPKDEPDANRPWADAERYAVLDAAPAHIRLPVALMMFAGIDPQGSLRLPVDAISDGFISLRRGKTGVPVEMPLLGALQEILDAHELPEHGSTLPQQQG